MVKQMQHSRKKLNQARLLAGILCLLAYSAGSSGTLPGLCALTASLDSSHRARIELADDAFTVVLSHGQKVGGDPSLHRHGTVARWLCVLADQHSAGADHRLQFRSGGTSESPDKGLKVDRSATALPLECLTLLKPEVTANAACGVASATAGSLLSTRSTILLI